MIILIPIQFVGLLAEVSDQFARASHFLIYNDETKEKLYLENKASASSGGAGIKAAQQALDLKVNVLLTPRIGENAAIVLKNTKIDIYKTVGRNVDENIQMLLNGKLHKLENFVSGRH